MPTSQTGPEKPLTKRLPLYTIWFCSGFAALCYEVTWARQFGLVLGFTSEAAATVLMVFFGGLGAGYFLGSRRAPHSTNPLRIYGLLELGIAVTSLPVPLLLAKTGDSWLVCALSVLPTTTLMGLTLPYMSRIVEQLPARNSMETPLAYGLNTLGAVAGSLISTFVLFRILGISGTGFFAVAISLFCAGIALGMASPVERVEPLAHRPVAKLVGWSIVTGATIVALQVLATRLFALVFHNSVYTFGVIVTVFLLAIASASLVVARIKRDITLDRISLLAETGVFALMIALAIFLFWSDLRYFAGSWRFAEFLIVAMGIVASVVFVPVFLLSMILPATWKIAATDFGWSRSSGYLSAWNAIGCSFGAGIAHFVMLPRLGLFGALAWLAAGVLFYAFVARSTKLRYLPSSLAGGLLTIVTWQYGAGFDKLPAKARLLASWESSYGRVEVVEYESGDRVLRQNIHYGLGTIGHYLGDLTFDPEIPVNTDEYPYVELNAPIFSWDLGRRLRYRNLRRFYETNLEGLPQQWAVPRVGVSRLDRVATQQWQESRLGKPERD